MANCEHIDMVNDVTPSAAGCEDCLRIGSSWVHLRMCLVCGHVGCCDSSRNRHARKHWELTGHPLVKSVEPGEEWAYCFADNAIMKQAPKPAD